MEIVEWISDALGLSESASDLTIAQMSLRALVIFCFTLLALKFGKKRMMAKNSALDVVLSVILGSVISRGINGTAAFVPTLAASLTLILVYRLLAWMAAHSERVSDFVEGKSAMLMREGVIDWEAMRRHAVTHQDLETALRQALNTNALEKAQAIYLEPNGTLTVVAKSA